MGDDDDFEGLLAEEFQNDGESDHAWLTSCLDQLSDLDESPMLFDDLFQTPLVRSLERALRERAVSLAHLNEERVRRNVTGLETDYEPQLDTCKLLVQCLHELVRRSTLVCTSHVVESLKILLDVSCSPLLSHVTLAQEVLVFLREAFNGMRSRSSRSMEFSSLLSLFGEPAFHRNLMRIFRAVTTLGGADRTKAAPSLRAVCDVLNLCAYHHASARSVLEQRDVHVLASMAAEDYLPAGADYDHVHGLQHAAIVLIGSMAHSGTSELAMDIYVGSTFDANTETVGEQHPPKSGHVHALLLEPNAGRQGRSFIDTLLQLVAVTGPVATSDVRTSVFKCLCSVVYGNAEMQVRVARTLVVVCSSFERPPQGKERLYAVTLVLNVVYGNSRARDIVCTKEVLSLLLDSIVAQSSEPAVGSRALKALVACVHNLRKDQLSRWLLHALQSRDILGGLRRSPTAEHGRAIALVAASTVPRVAASEADATHPATNPQVSDLHFSAADPADDAVVGLSQYWFELLDFAVTAHSKNVNEGAADVVDGNVPEHFASTGDDDDDDDQSIVRRWSSNLYNSSAWGAVVTAMDRALAKWNENPATKNKPMQAVSTFSPLFLRFWLGTVKPDLQKKLGHDSVALLDCLCTLGFLPSIALALVLDSGTNELTTDDRDFLLAFVASAAHDCVTETAAADVFDLYASTSVVTKLRIFAVIQPLLQKAFMPAHVVHVAGVAAARLTDLLSAPGDGRYAVLFPELIAAAYFQQAQDRLLAWEDSLRDGDVYLPVKDSGEFGLVRCSTSTFNVDAILFPRTASLDRIKASLGSVDAGSMRFFHATTETRVVHMLEAVERWRPHARTALQDFGVTGSVYFFSRIEDAHDHVLRNEEKWKLPASTRPKFQRPCILVADVAIAELAGLNVLKFEGVTTDWKQVVWRSRNGIYNEADDYDAVLGPILAKTDAGSYVDCEPFPEKQQLAVKSADAAALMHDSISRVIVYGSTRTTSDFKRNSDGRATARAKSFVGRKR